MSRATIVIVSALAMVATACGGRSEMSTAQWVSSVCTGAAKWDARVERAVFDLPEVRWSSKDYGDSAAVLRSDSYANGVDEFARTLEDVVDDVGDLPAPSTDAGRRGKELLDSWAHRFEMSVETFQNAGRDLPRDAGLEEVRSEVFKIYPVLDYSPAHVIPYIGVAIGGELKTLFEHTLACRQLGKGRRTPAPGSNSSYERVPGEDWASRICRRLSAAEREIGNVYVDVRAMRLFPSVVTKGRVLADIEAARRALRDLRADLKAIPAPKIRRGAHAKETVEAFNDFHVRGGNEELVKIRSRVTKAQTRDAIVRLLGDLDGLSGLQVALVSATPVRGFDVFLRDSHPPAAAAFRATKACYRS